MKDIVNHAFRWGLAGLLVGPAVVYSMMLVVLYRDPSCAPGGGVCQLDIGLNMIIGLVVGFLAFFAITLIRGLRKRRREAR
ncbi:hypothetical protein [Mesorhizobium sp. CAU 1732]|uniref:hypothetical protein n=1 Tax=Mesorhizobium sp. CAU 1732 TaxID=3140358 RepID=UPI00325FFB61